MKKSITRISPIISCALFFSFIPVGIADGALNTGQLTCDGWENPLGVDRATPMLSWKPQGKGRAERQTAYRILVASSTSQLERDQGDLWGIRAKWKPGLTRAVFHVCGLGHYALEVKGKEAQERRPLTPGWTDYEDTVLYDTLDITPFLLNGRNALGVTLDGGLYSHQKNS